MCLGEVKLRKAQSAAAAAAAVSGSVEGYTLEEVAKHATASDCWLAVSGKVYDVSRWVHKHPGGSMIYVKAGGDATQLFNSYHPHYVRKMLDKFYVGDVVPTPSSGAPPKGDPGAAPAALAIEYEEEECEFYRTLRTRVDGYFRSSRLNPRFSYAMYAKTAMILVGLVASYLCTFYLSSSLAVACLFGLVFGTLKAEVGVSIQHDANHGAYAPLGWVGDVIGVTLDLVGASSFMWKQQHVVGHHAYTNVVSADPDVRVSDPDVRRCADSQPWRPYHRYQHIYLGFLYGLLSLKSTLLDDFKAWSEGAIGPVKLAQFTPTESMVFWGSKAFYFGYWFVLPLFFSPLGVGSLAAVWLSSEMVTGWLLAFMFQVAHVSDDVSFFERAEDDGVVKKSWAVSQVESTADFCHGSSFWTHFSGGLNYQVVHHLFPGVCHCHYPQLAPIVMKTCKEFGVRYQVYETFWAALSGHIEHLRKVGAEVAIPSLANVG